jgi:hypothetical protein
VRIYNLFTKGTIEEHILALLHEKINLFELVIGGLDVILERFEQKTSLEAQLLRLAVEAKDDRDIRSKLDELGQSFKTIRDTVGDETDGALPLAAVVDAVGQSVPVYDTGIASQQRR